MPIYECLVPSTGEKYEVMHAIDQELKTFGELAEILGLESDASKADTPINRVFAGRVFVNGNLGDLSKGKVNR